ncbi:unnamed protein product [Larinioides sclopetarius]|uniref:Uncharacterized protein n=1 Tax=Larinioides sclopetarius TaxID=280406 RepID=A0AAV1ZTP3_9ARAC
MVFVEGYDGERNKISQVNLMSAECANILKLRKEKANVPVSGINGTVCTIKSKLNATISNAENSFKEEMEFLIVSNITDRTPSTTLDIENLELPPNVKLSDSEFFKPSKIQLLLGIDPFFKIFKCNKIKIGDSLTLQDTVIPYLADEDYFKRTVN